MKLTECQCAKVSYLEDDELIKDTALRIKKKHPQITESDVTYLPRLKAAFEYANTIPLKEENTRRNFLLLETFYPDFYQNPEVDKWLRTPNGYSADQRLEDYKHVMINRERRRL